MKRRIYYWLTRDDDKCWYHKKKWYNIDDCPTPFSNTIHYRTFRKAITALANLDGPEYLCKMVRRGKHWIYTDYVKLGLR